MHSVFAGDNLQNALHCISFFHNVGSKRCLQLLELTIFHYLKTTSFNSCLCILEISLMKGH